ncbi:MAG: hypothetical protein KDD35_10435, partial [Bdellovibrionales bacterium]|nr:hypothetical protein [Bdellovibrionales bacterium]
MLSSGNTSLKLRLAQLIELRQLENSGKKIHVVGTSSPTLAAALASDYDAWDGGQPRLILVSSHAELKPLKECLQFFAPKKEIFLLPGFDVEPYSGLYPNPQLTSARIRWLSQAQDSQPGQIFIASLPGILQKTIPFGRLMAAKFQITKGDTIDSQFFQRLEALGYHSATIVDTFGAYSRRGGILDLFSPHHLLPLRLELFGDTLESIRPFQPESQRSHDDELESFVILPPREVIYSEEDLQNIVDRYKSTTVGREINNFDLESILHSLSQQQYFPGIEFLISQFYPDAETPLDHFCRPISLISLDPLEIARSKDQNWSALQKTFEEASHNAIRPRPEELSADWESLNWPDKKNQIEFSKIHL